MTYETETRISLHQLATKLDAEVAQLTQDAKRMEAHGFRALAGDLRSVAHRLTVVSSWCKVKA